MLNVLNICVPFCTLGHDPRVMIWWPKVQQETKSIITQI